MKDLIERLRSHATPFAHEAADAIEKLEAENAALKEELARVREQFNTVAEQHNNLMVADALRKLKERRS